MIIKLIIYQIFSVIYIIGLYLSFKMN